MFQLIQNVNIQFEICVNGSVDTENGALAYGANVFHIKTLILQLKYNEILKNINIPFEIFALLYGIEILSKY